ncbi:MAG: universal stress protein [Acidobacteria bacterium]|nr:universal stress protein [Acidobacteriota bacterium]
MKILIGYDGSQCAENALADLNRAGLPLKAEARVITVSEEWIPAPASIGGVMTTFPADNLKHEEEAAALAGSAKAVINSIFPEWHVHPEAAIGSPANILIWKAEEWNPDLIVVGSHGRTALGRLFFGSVSQKVLHAATCSVRIARGKENRAKLPVRLIVGVDGSNNAEFAVAALIRRSWPKGSEARVVGATGVFPPVATEYLALEVEKWIAEENTRVQEAVEAAASKLRGIGLGVSSVVKEGDANYLLCDEAEGIDADCIFVGARGMGRIERTLLGSVSSAVASRAHCSVEVIRD